MYNIVECAKCVPFISYHLTLSHFNIMFSFVQKRRKVKDTSKEVKLVIFLLCCFTLLLSVLCDLIQPQCLLKLDNLSEEI